jgi:hypothetical protein
LQIFKGRFGFILQLNAEKLREAKELASRA